MNLNKFFKEISEESNYLNNVTVQEVYYAILKVILRELKKSGKIVLTDFGTFRIHDSKSRSIYDINTKSNRIISDKKIVKFRPAEKLRLYVRDKM